MVSTNATIYLKHKSPVWPVLTPLSLLSPQSYRSKMHPWPHLEICVTSKQQVNNEYETLSSE